MRRVLPLILLAAVSCKTRQDGSALRDDGAPAGNAQAYSPGKDPANPAVTATLGSSSLPTLTPLAQAMDQTMASGLVAANLELGAGGGTAMALADTPSTQSAADVRQIVTRLNQQLQQARNTLTALQQLGDTSDQTKQLAAMVAKLDQQLNEQRANLAVLEGKEAQAQATAEAAAEAARQQAERDRLERERLAQQQAREEAAAAQERLRRERDAEIAAIQQLVRDLYREGGSRDGSGCTVRVWLTTNTIDLNAEGRWPWSSTVVRHYADLQIWSTSPLSKYLSSGEDLIINGGTGTFLLLAFPDDCASSFRGDSGVYEYMGESQVGTDTFQLYGILNQNLSFNVSGGVTITGNTNIYRRSRLQINGDGVPTPNLDAKSKIFTTLNDCRGIAEANQFFCDGWDCKGITQGRPGFCDTNDCKALIAKDSSLCDSYDCRGMLNRQPSLCDSRGCVAFIAHDRSKCN